MYIKITEKNAIGFQNRMKSVHDEANGDDRTAKQLRRRMALDYICERMCAAVGFEDQRAVSALK